MARAQTIEEQIIRLSDQVLKADAVKAQQINDTISRLSELVPKK